jgi:diketogulonate reductase-like aldo/keto reductase
LLEEAMALGITHFDTARAYGAGESEVVLGEFIKRQRDRVRVTTKCGIEPYVAGSSVRQTYDKAIRIPAIGLVHKVVRAVRRIGRPSVFSPENIRRSVETSLSKLDTEYVDYLLLHEATVPESNRRSTLATLDELVRQGKVRTYGVGSALAKLGRKEAKLSRKYRVVQFEHNVLEPKGLRMGAQDRRDVFTHTALKPFGKIAELIGRHPELVKRYSATLDTDLADRGALAGLLLGYSHQQNPRGKVVFSTGSVSHLRRNVEVFAAFTRWPSARQADLVRFFDALVGASSSG